MKIYNDKREIIVLLLLLVIAVELIWTGKYFSKPTPTTPSASGGPEAVALPEAVLGLSPSEGAFAAGENFEVQIVLETADTVATDGVDVTLSFDPQKLEILDVSSTDFYPQRLKADVNNEEGIARLAVANMPNQEEIRGGGTVATITFKPLQAGEAEVTFGASNVASNGLNILSQTSDGLYTIE